MSSKIIGQEDVVKEINRIFDIFIKSKSEIRPHFMLTGQSGSGKTHSIKTLTELKKLHFVELNAAQLTKEGMSGNSLSKSLTPLLNSSGRQTIVFVDEFDKLFISGNQNSSVANETTVGVQNEFLKVLESDTASVFGDYGKYINVNIKNTLFVFAGAFNNEEHVTLDKLRNFGVKTEFLGRVGLIYNLKKLELSDLFLLIDTSELLNTYLSLFPTTNRETVVDTIKDYIAKTYENNSIGARLINTLINQYFIKGGKIGFDDIKDISFQETMVL